MAGVREGRSGGCLRRLTAICALVVAASIPAGSAAASPGDVYVTDYNSSTVWKYPAAGGTDTAVEWGQHPGLDDLFSLALGADGRLYAGDDDSEIWAITTADGSESVAGRIPSATGWALAAAPQGRILVVDSSGNDVYSLNPADGSAARLLDGPDLSSSYEGIAAARDGSFFLSDSGTDALYRFQDGALTPVVSGDPGFINPSNLALSADERYLYVLADPNDRLVRVDLTTGARIEQALGAFPRGLALTPDNRVLIAFNDGLATMPVGGGALVPFASDPDVIGGGDVVIEPAPCAGRTPTVVGTVGKDVIKGSAFADVISTLGGKDTVKGLAGNDVVCGGPGRDRLFGQAGRDKLLGQGGRDILRGGKGKDKLKGGAGKDGQRQ